MAESFEFYSYLSHLRRRWRIPAAAGAIAISISLLFGLLQTPRYTARVRLLIEPPASSDPRAAMAVSPIYLESLRTYEHFASSDHLFAEAAKHFKLQTGDWRLKPLEDLKRRVLRVSIPRNTKVLEIDVTLTDADKAHALARYLAQKTIELSRQAGSTSDLEMIATAQQELEATGKRFTDTGKALGDAMKQAPTPLLLQSQLDDLEDRKRELDHLDLSAAITGSTATNRAERRAEAERLDQQIRQTQEQLSARKASLELLTIEHKAALEARESAERRLRDIRGMSGGRSERINLLDPGFVPERPSWPNIPLTVVVAALLALLFSIAWVTFDFSRRQMQPVIAPKLTRVVGKP